MYNKIKRIVSQANTYFTSRDEYNSISRVLEDYSANPAPVNNINPLQCKKAGFVVGGINQFGGVLRQFSELVHIWQISV